MSSKKYRIEKDSKVQKVPSATILSALLFVSQGVLARTDAQAIGAVIAPAELMASYACVGYAEAKFIPMLQSRFKSIIGDGKASASDVKKLLQGYDDVLAKMCNEVEPVFVRSREQVHSIYAQQLPRSTADEAAVLTSPTAKRWGAENGKFLASTAPLLQMIAFAREIVPELLDPKPPQALSPTWRVNSEVRQEVQRTAAGMQAQMERIQLIHFLNDKGFAQLAPDRYNLDLLAKEELRLRKEAAKLNSSSLYWFNDNASDLTRMHFNGFDVMRQMGTAPIYLRYEAQMLQIGR